VSVVKIVLRSRKVGGVGDEGATEIEYEIEQKNQICRRYHHVHLATDPAGDRNGNAYCDILSRRG
jgi:hypothetical protein